jgi:hypothetical protein
MRLTPEQVLDKLGSGNGDYDDGDIPGWLSIDTNGDAVWEDDPGEGEVKVMQRFRVTVVEIEGEGS